MGQKPQTNKKWELASPLSKPELGEVTDRKPLKAPEQIQSVESVVPECANATEARHGETQPRRETAVFLHLLSSGTSRLGVPEK